ncbi:MAG: YggS family pyridoxal phosphate-dependent enzyme [Armatimonadetes bacterium]|nr:YggS family pyridoxal phosphate-dependent enzyme [Armatimonadota bacterium]
MPPASLLDIQNRIQAACDRVGRDAAGVTLIGASKTVPAAQLEEFFAAGLRDFGENYVAEGIEKVRHFRERDLNATWHLIGALQSNKARQAVAHFGLIHSLDRLSLARELDKEARKIGKTQRVLVQVNVGNEATKAGVAPDELPALLNDISALENLQIEGLMSLPPYRENPENSRPFHRLLRELRAALPSSVFRLPHLSMGMSNDFEIAVEEGATMVRVGTALFGARG